MLKMTKSRHGRQHHHLNAGTGRTVLSCTRNVGYNGSSTPPPLPQHQAQYELQPQPRHQHQHQHQHQHYHLHQYQHQPQLQPQPQPQHQHQHQPAQPNTGLDSTVLTQILPSLVHWRLLTFYGPFFTGASFSSPYLETHTTTSTSKCPRPPRQMTPIGETLESINRRSTSQYAAHRARQQADALLADLKATLGVNGTKALSALYAQYTREGESYQSRNSNVGWPVSRSPATKATRSAAKQLKTPVRQVEAALEMYVRHIRDGCDGDTDTDTDTGSLEVQNSRNSRFHRHEVWDAVHMAAAMKWADLARIVYDDTRDLAGSSSSSSLLSLGCPLVGGPSKSTYLAAVKACRALYFEKIDAKGSKVGRCRCRCGRHRRFFRLWPWLACTDTSAVTFQLAVPGLWDEGCCVSRRARVGNGCGDGSSDGDVGIDENRSNGSGSGTGTGAGARMNGPRRKVVVKGKRRWVKWENEHGVGKENRWEKMRVLNVIEETEEEYEVTG